MEKYYTISDGKLSSFDAYPLSGDYRIRQNSAVSGSYLYPYGEETSAEFTIIRRDGTIPAISFPSFALETTPFRIIGVERNVCKVMAKIFEYRDKLYLQIAMVSDWDHRIQKFYDLTTGQEVTTPFNEYYMINVLYSILNISNPGQYRLFKLIYYGVEFSLLFSMARSGIDNPVYSYNLHTVGSGTYSNDYYYVPADVIYSLGNQSTGTDPGIATRALAVAQQAERTANAAMTAINLANLDDKISV